MYRKVLKKYYLRIVKKTKKFKENQIKIEATDDNGTKICLSKSHIQRIN